MAHSYDLQKQLLLQEYTSLKAEQVARIGFRDNLLYVSLSSIGAVFAFVATNSAYADALILIPWISTIIGWTYVVNDHHVSRIGLYIRTDLREALKRPPITSPVDLFQWEEFHRSDATRVTRKYIQLFIDITTFTCSGVIALLVFVTSSESVSKLEWAMVASSFLSLFVVTTALIYYSDTGRSNKVF